MRRRAMILLIAMVGALVVGSGVALAATTVTCTSNPCPGTTGADVINGTPDPETINALAGNDLVKGFGGSDETYGGDGNDLVDGFGGNDTIYGGRNGDGSAQGTDFSNVDITNLEGAEDSDKVYGGGGPDYIDAAAHDDPLESQTPPIDSSFGGSGNDRIFAADGNEDIIDCGTGTGDRVLMDPIDTQRNCESVTIS
jgi:Ca2+-binding RTX toxin-like protein